MSEQEELTLDMPHIAALTMAIWIYLIAQNDEAREIIGNLADRLKNEMNVIGEDGEEERTEQDSGPASNSEG